MLRITLACLLTSVLSAAATAAAEEDGQGDKVLSGMSVVGNDEAPKSLVIVPWKSSGLGDAIDLSSVRDDGHGPVDREVFRRQLDYYRIRTGSPEGPGASEAR